MAAVATLRKKRLDGVDVGVVRSSGCGEREYKHNGCGDKPRRQEELLREGTLNHYTKRPRFRFRSSILPSSCKYTSARSPNRNFREALVSFRGYSVPEGVHPCSSE